MLQTVCLGYPNLGMHSGGSSVNSGSVHRYTCGIAQPSEAPQVRLKGHDRFLFGSFKKAAAVS